MENVYYSLKDFELSLKKNAIERADDFQQYINQLNEFGCKSYWITSQTGVGSTMTIEGFDRPVTAFISNDYLGMSQREETKQAGIDAIIKYGTGACAAQVIGGYLDIHQQLEQEIASFVGQEDAILFSSGFGANAGILRALLGQNDIALVDPYIHTSAMAGLKGTNVKRIGHNDLEYLEKTLKETKDQYQTRLVIIDGVYSQDGDLSLLPEIISLCKTHEAMLMLDDAHGIGVMGANGKGTARTFQLFRASGYHHRNIQQIIWLCRRICCRLKKDNTIPEILCGQQCLLGSPYTTSNRIHFESFGNNKERTGNKSQTLGKYRLP